MSLRLEMLQVARLAPQHLDEAADAVGDYLFSQFNADGGASDRSGRSDLYYTVFALEGLLALRREAPLEPAAGYLESFGSGDDLDFVHLCCLARCWASLGNFSSALHRPPSLGRALERYRTVDGGYNAAKEEDAFHGTAYHAFLALGAYQDLQAEIPRPEALLDSLKALRSQDGAYANRPGLAAGTTTACAAAAALHRHLGSRPPEGLSDWLLRRLHPQGGFLAVPQAPMPDLLSTATALHALSGLSAFPRGQREPCLDFIDSLWTGKAFCGHWADDQADAEYTYYALLALGHLAL